MSKPLHLEEMDLKTEDYPMLFQESDSLAIKAQSKHLLFVRTKIAFLVAIAVIMSVSWNQELGLRTPAAVTLAVSLVISMAFTALMNTKRFDHAWVSFRATAESIKTETWLFMMKVEPYEGSITDIQAKDRYLKRLDEILHCRPSVRSQLALHLKEGPQITKQMKEIRNEKLANRREFYVQNRIQDQRRWYVEKSKWNKKRESLWFIVTWILELAAASLAIVAIILQDTFINPVGIVTTAGAGVLSWINARSYSEPAESYGFVAEELVIIQDRANQVSTEKDLAKIVLDAERTIDREHTIWLARL
jgi:hypothetical protein